jgi:hypothetical protein
MLTITTWESVDIGCADSSGTAQPRNEVWVPLREMWTAARYEFDLPAPASVRFFGDVLEVDGLAPGRRGIAHSVTRMTRDGPAQSLVLDAKQIRGHNPIFRVNAAPDFTSGLARLGRGAQSPERRSSSRRLFLPRRISD